MRCPMPLPPPVTNATRSFSKFSRNTLIETKVPKSLSLNCVIFLARNITQFRLSDFLVGLFAMNRKGVTASLAVLVAVNILNFYDRHVIGALTEPIRKEFSLTDSQVGLMGSAFIWLYALVGLPLGRVADAWSRRKLLACGMLVWSALTALAASAANYTILLCSRLGFAIGEAVVAPA